MRRLISLRRAINPQWQYKPGTSLDADLSFVVLKSFLCPSPSLQHCGGGLRNQPYRKGISHATPEAYSCTSPHLSRHSLAATSFRSRKRATNKITWFDADKVPVLAEARVKFWHVIDGWSIDKLTDLASGNLADNYSQLEINDKTPS
jgi:hypothetical protein